MKEAERTSLQEFFDETFLFFRIMMHLSVFSFSPHFLETYVPSSDCYFSETFSFASSIFSSLSSSWPSAFFQLLFSVPVQIRLRNVTITAHAAWSPPITPTLVLALTWGVPDQAGH